MQLDPIDAISGFSFIPEWLLPQIAAGLLLTLFLSHIDDCLWAFSTPAMPTFTCVWTFPLSQSSTRFAAAVVTHIDDCVYSFFTPVMPGKDLLI